VDVQTSVGLLVLDNGEVAETSPDSQSILLAVGHALEVVTSLLVDTLLLDTLNLCRLLSSGLVLGLKLGDLCLESLDLLSLAVCNGADLDVDLIQVADGVCLEGLIAAELLETNGQNTVLLAPITEVVDAGDVPASSLVQVAQETSDDG
jgi:hypothetical protein